MVVKLYTTRRHLRPALIVLFVVFCLSYNAWHGRDTARTSVKVHRQENNLPGVDNTKASDSKPYHLDSHFGNLPPNKAAVNQKVLETAASNECPDWQGIEDIFVIMRTGATESQERLPPQFNTTFKCMPNFAVFSDFAEEIDGHMVHDALDEYHDSMTSEYDEFSLHYKLKKFGKTGLISDDISGGKQSSGWKLDKWKFLPLIDKVLRMHSTAKWYVIMDADTHILFSNLLRWLKTIDHTKPHYLGARWFIDGQAFAQGGSGIVISGQAMKMAGQKHAENIEAYNNYTARKWAGDEVLGKLMQDAGVPCTDTQPIIQSFSPSLMYGGDLLNRPKDRRLWCYPAVSYHHMTPREISDVFEFERWWTSKPNFNPVRHGDIFKHVVIPQILPERQAWDNSPEDNKFEREGKLSSYTEFGPPATAQSELEKQSQDSYENCKKLCQSQANCMQWLYEPGRCTVSRIFVQGHARETQYPQSGWMTERIAQFVKQKKQENCPNDLWIYPEV